MVAAPDVDRVIAGLVAAAGRHPADAAPQFEAPASPEDLAAFERAAGTAIPAQMRAFLERHRAVVAMDIRNGYWIGGPSELARALRRGDYPTVVDGGGRPTRVVPVATDGGGNAFLVSLDIGDVWRWDHETGAVARVARDFAEFLRRVAQDWEREADGDDAWTYLV